MIPRRVWLAVLVAFLGHGIFVLTAHYRLSYDAFTHMLFADHYARDWFSLWDTRWYTGFTVVSYPPLVHQLIALFIPLLGFDKAFALILWTGATLYPLGIYTFSRIFTGKAAASYAALASAVLLPVYVTAHIFGQLPFFISTLFALFGAASLARYLRDGGGLTLALTVSLAATTMAAHHATLLVQPFFILAVAVSQFNLQDWKIKLGRLALFAALAILAGILVIWPFWQWGLTQTMQTPIDHLSRHNLLTDLFAQVIFFWPVYLPLIAVIPFLFRKWPRRFWGLIFSFGLLFLLGLGGATPLPRFLFGKGWEWLTYDRFAFWAALTLLPFFGTLFIFFKRGWKNRIPPKLLPVPLRGTFFSALAFSVFAVPVLLAWLTPIVLPIQPAPIDMQPIVDFLKQDDRSQYRYLTFGFGDQFAYLNLLTEATTIDGSYHTARTLPELRESGIAQIDTVYWALKGIPAIGPILKKSGEHGVRWGFVNRSDYIPELKKDGWVYLETLSNKIQVWENPSAVVPPPSTPPAVNPLASFSWGILPLLSLAISLSLTGLRLRPLESRKVLSGVYSLTIGLLPLSLTFWYFRTLNIVTYPRIYFTYTDALFFLSDGLAFIAIISWLIVRTFAWQAALRLRSDEEHVLTPLSEEYLRPERSRRSRGVVEGQVHAKVIFLLFCLLVTLSILWSVDWHISLYVSLHWWLVFGLFLSLRDHPSAWKAFAVGCIAALTFQSLIGFWEFTAQSGNFLAPFGLNWPQALDPNLRGTSIVQAADGTRILRVYGTLPHPNILGGFIVAFMAGLVAIFLVRVKRDNISLYSLAAIGLAINLLVLTFSRSAWLGLIALMLFLFLKYKHFDKKRLTLLGIVGLLSFAVIAYSVRGLIFTRLGGTANAETESYSTVTRLALTEFTFNMIRAHPLLGVGIGNFVVEMQRTTPPDQTIEPMHNLPLLAFSELGVGSVILFVGLGGAIFISLRRARQPVNIIFTAVLIVILVTSLFDHYFWTLAPGRLVFGMMLGLWAGTMDTYGA